ncbi:ATP-binding protein [Paratractidigestivibacter sp.]|uniref:ATP-binding protein n=1 Tax=Paratractidigestivibacter sp. TaxID=2847316 RepID=UPI002ACB07C7|nr:ATP-binding protein [Paratractidigestivibacter sp.]
MTISGSGLLGFVASMGGERNLRVEENLGEGYVRLRVAEAERRQAKHDIRCAEDIVIEMLRNSRDAGAKHIYVATAREGDLRTITILDDGSGIPADMQDRVFEARVTSKLESVHMDRWGVHGRGMALYSVKENAESAEVVSSAPGRGSSIRVVTDASRLPERADQSTWPTTGIDESGGLICERGPHNIVRTCCEFAIEERATCEVYFGSPSEIAATARARAPRTVEASELMFIDDISELPILERLRAASDASELHRVATSLGLDMSERTAHRIVSGQIKTQRSIVASLTRRSRGKASKPEVDLSRDHRGLKLSHEDSRDFSREMERCFQMLADRYYLTLTDEPKIRIGKGKITVTFQIEQAE